MLFRSNYDDKKGVRHYVTEILVENMEMLSNRPQPTETNVAQQPTAQPVQQESASEPEDEALPF